MKILRRVFKIVVYAAALFLIIVLTLGVITQTAYFKDRVRMLLVSALSEGINGSIRSIFPSATVRFCALPPGSI